MLRQSVCVTVAALVLAGCSTIPKPPSCDGYSRRPLNKSMWEQVETQHENSSAELSEITSDQSDEADERPPSAMVYTTALHADPDAPLRACG